MLIKYKTSAFLSRSALTTAALLALCSSPALRVCSAQVAIAQQDKPETISLRVAPVLDVAETTLAFNLVNNSNEEVHITEFGGNVFNGVILITPGGKEIRLFPEGYSRPFIVKPAQSFTWKRNMRRALEAYQVKEPGLYTLRWNVSEIEVTAQGEKIGKVHQAEAFILKEDEAKPGK